MLTRLNSAPSVLQVSTVLMVPLSLLYVLQVLTMTWKGSPAAWDVQKVRSVGRVPPPQKLVLLVSILIKVWSVSSVLKAHSVLNSHLRRLVAQLELTRIPQELLNVRIALRDITVQKHRLSLRCALPVLTMT